MIINGVQSQITHTTEVNNDTVGKDDFLKLLIAQLSHQDPMDPLDNNQFISQMTEFSSLEQLEQINSGVGSTNLLTQSMNNAFSTTLIGRNVVINSDQAEVREGRPVNCGFYAPGAGSAVISITNSNGTVVRELEVEADDSGFIRVNWDGKNGSGNTVVDGNYFLKVNFQTGDGMETALAPFLTGHVSAVKFMSGNAYLTVNGQEYNLAQVVEVTE
ncbi:MAG: hypothetical protein JXB45_09105 [Candidatus Krumholzibacteriota bacterium]|nr:hypothetical protein [Candidatus Krumholzibacteriota bacterium]